MKWWRAIKGGDLPTAIAMQHQCSEILQEAIIPLAFEGFNDALVRKHLVYMNQPRRVDNISMKYNGQFVFEWLRQAKILSYYYKPPF
jgi:hypothetical protein